VLEVQQVTDESKARLFFFVILPTAIALLLALAFWNTAQAGERIILHHDASGNDVSVVVRSDDCPGNPGRGCSMYVAYIGWNEKRLVHELAHIAGMRHTVWKKNGFGQECSRVTVAGVDTGYRVGEVICAGFDGSDQRE
jgi:hypothetical protein